MKVKSSSIAEVVIAVTIIASCFGIGVLIYSRSSQIVYSYEELDTQTRIQNELFKQHVMDFSQDTLIKQINLLGEIEYITETQTPTSSTLLFLRNNGNLLWQQEVLK